MRWSGPDLKATKINLHFFTLFCVAECQGFLVLDCFSSEPSGANSTAASALQLRFKVSMSSVMVLIRSCKLCADGQSFSCALILPASPNDVTGAVLQPQQLGPVRSLDGAQLLQ